MFNLCRIGRDIARHEEIEQRRAGIACAIGQGDTRLVMIVRRHRAARAMHLDALIITKRGTARIADGALFAAGCAQNGICAVKIATIANFRIG